MHSEQSQSKIIQEPNSSPTDESQWGQAKKSTWRGG